MLLLEVIVLSVLQNDCIFFFWMELYEEFECQIDVDDFCGMIRCFVYDFDGVMIDVCIEDLDMDEKIMDCGVDLWLGDFVCELFDVESFYLMGFGDFEYRYRFDFFGILQVLFVGRGVDRLS